MELKEKLVVLRKEKGLTQLKLAEMMNLSRQAVSRWEAGNAVPSTDNLKYLGSLYDVPLEYLLHDDVLETIQADPESGKAETSSVNEVKKKNIVLGLILVGIVVVAIGCILFGSKDEDLIPMKEIEGSDMVIVDDFEMDW